MKSMFFSKLFTRPKTELVFSKDLPENERAKLHDEMKACIERRGGTLKNSRRAQALSNLFGRLSPDGQLVYIQILETLNDDLPETSPEIYSKLEEAEMFGRSATKLAVLDAFETPRRRLIEILSRTESGPEALENISNLASREVTEDIKSFR